MKNQIPPHRSGEEIRNTFIKFFTERGHTFVPSSSLVPGGDQTLLFTNAGMVQFKDVFLGTDQRPYNRAVDSQKCLRVAGKHNDLDEVGRDDKHHTFFEMLGNWSFGDYYKKEAVAWAWELITGVWGLPKEHLYAAAFKDEKGEIPTDDEVVEAWTSQPGFDPTHIFYFGRKDNFWEMAETGPCGPNSELHLDLHPELGPVKPEDISSPRFLELWNLVFIQYNRSGPNSLELLPAKHVDTGMGLERIVSVLQGVDSNYRTDLFWPLIEETQRLTGDSDEAREASFTPYRVIADHARAAAFLIADGVIPGNTRRNYVCRMIIRRAARFGSKIGLNEPFLANVAQVVIDRYGDFYPELVRNRPAILDSITREELRFQRTIQGALDRLESLLGRLRGQNETVVPGDDSFELYATYGLPFEITRDIAREQGFETDEEGFKSAMEQHKFASGAGEAFGPLGDEGVDLYRRVLNNLQAAGKIGPEGVRYDPYGDLEVEGALLALLRDGQPVESAGPGDTVEVILPETCFYVESGGQVADTGSIVSAGEPVWEIRVDDTRRPAAGVIVQRGEVLRGEPRPGDLAIARVDSSRRLDIMRNHTATHLLHAELRAELGEHARQAGSLVAPDRLRFDFNHPEALSPEQLARIEAGVNRDILENHPLNMRLKPLQQAVSEGAMALFGEKYTETVRTIQIGTPEPFSYELCGGTHVGETGDIGVFLITSEGSVASGIRRIEAVTGRGAYELIQRRFKTLAHAASLLDAAPEQVPDKVQSLLEENGEHRRQIAGLRADLASTEFERLLQTQPVDPGMLEKPSGTGLFSVHGVPLLTAILPGADSETLRQMTDRFRQRYPSGAVVLASVIDGRPLLVAAVTDDLVKRGLHAGELVKFVAQPLGGGGGGRPGLAQAGGKDPARLNEALARVPGWIAERI